MTLQNGEPEDSRANPLQPGVPDAAARAPDGGSFAKGPGDGARKKRKNPRFQSVSEMSLRKLKRLHGESQGRNLDVVEELRRRGFNSQMLEAAQWEWGQQQWAKNRRQSGHAAAAGAQGKQDELAKWRRLPITVRSTTDDQRNAPDRRSKRQRRFERRLEKRRQEREAGLRRRKRRR